MTRFIVITDAAVAVVAELGMRGLTHRAVDSRAGLPPGTTSAYFRTRKALIEALVQRLADLDRADLERAELEGQRLPADPDALAASIAAVIDSWLTTGRDRTLARYACLLEATHHPELRTILGHGESSRVQARALLAAAGAAHPDQAGDHFVACVDGLLFDRLIGAGALTAPTPGTPQSRADLATAVRAVLRGLSEQPGPPAPPGDPQPRG
ncbi:TetR/AcrR family transcriptional regulator [Actinoplanes friuliensis]|uniref:TetR-family transcriptional regulator n=1 Tax=Actinoplanes friuliensis DSM 7358 TaxID=1246995 RepID=U5W7D9_9ACTN|nr:TetR/AcrR family transcriptional regulator [Actinoplanes friuliensis]AGZ43866.1 TetR-family transcriptional regulator [Actinoplanes friuliensis DSM 7358]